MGTERRETGAIALGRLAATSPPTDALEPAVGRVVDCLALCIIARRRPEVVSILAQVVEMGGARVAAAVGGDRVPPESAALVNGTAAHALGLDDFHAPTGIHPMVTVVPAALSAAEVSRVPGRQFLTAVLVGYEAACRLGQATARGALHARGFHPTSVLGTVAAGVAAAAALGLTAEQAAHAVAISATRAAGLFHFAPDAATKPLQAGWAAAAGVGAALLARRGMMGALDVLEAPHGLLWAVAGENAYSAAPLVAPMGTWAIQEVAYKPYAHSTDFHTAVDVALDLVRETGIKPDEIERVEVSLPPAVAYQTAEPVERKLRPSSRREAQQSLQFAMAVALLHAPPDTVSETFHVWFAPDRIADPEVLRLASLVVAQPDNRLDLSDPLESPAAVAITTRSGRRLTHRRTAHRGSPACPYSLDDLARRVNGLIGNRIDLVGPAARLPEARTVTELADVFLHG